jgi:5-oxoprolinase (ATP-hydrolysing)
MAHASNGSAHRVSVGVDIGGTFTDFVLLDHASRTVRTHKRLTTYPDPSSGMLDGLDAILAAAGVGYDACARILHGTTLVSNVLIERRGAITGLLTTQGFRDVLEVGYEQRYDIYDLGLRFPAPLIPRSLRREVRERVNRDGDVVQPISREQVGQQVEALVHAGVKAIAVCLLHSYANPAHEESVAEVIRSAHPEIEVSISSEIAAEVGEFARLSTTAANAYVQPLIRGYLESLEAQLDRRGFTGQFFLMQSNGGLMTPEVSRRLPIRLLESGPAGAATIAAFLGRELDLPDLVAFDMGGTTAKSCLILEGSPARVSEFEVARVDRFMAGSGLPIRTPAVDLIEIGAGGGSLAALNELGLLQIGPESAGADPGPACYGLGGEQPTVTDACVVLGYLDPASFLGGTMRLDPALAEKALDGLAKRAGLSLTETAWGVYNVACNMMAGAARAHIIERGQDPRRFPLVAFGGAGPIHAVRMARILGASEVIIPPLSGVASALGMLVAPMTIELSRSLPAPLASTQWDRLDGVYTQMREAAVEMFAVDAQEAAKVSLKKRADMRLDGQFHSIEVELPEVALSATAQPAIAKSFDSRYEQLYHSVLPDYTRMVITWRLLATLPPPTFDPKTLMPAPSSIGEARQRAARRVYFPEANGYAEGTPVYRRGDLGVGVRVEGPAIVEEPESTTVLGPGDSLVVDGSGSLRIKVGQ